MQTELKIADKVKPYQHLIDLLDTCPGINQRTAIAVLAETGSDLSAWDNHRKFAAMAGLCPGNYISAGKRLKNRSRQGNPYLKSIMVQAACSAVNSDGSYFHSKYKHLKQRRGHKRAIVAIAHAMLVAIYHMIKTDSPYQDPVPPQLASDARDRKADQALKLLRSLGYSVSIALA